MIEFRVSCFVMVTAACSSLRVTPVLTLRWHQRAVDRRLSVLAEAMQQIGSVVLGLYVVVLQCKVKRPSLRLFQTRHSSGCSSFRGCWRDGWGLLQIPKL